jgi:hypothetical protein
MNAIVGFTEQVLKTPLNHDQVDQLEIVKKSSYHLLKVINEILDLSKLGAGKLDLETIPFLFFRRDFHPAFHDFVMESFAAHGYKPIWGPMQEGLQTMWSLTAEGQGWSFAFKSQRTNPPPGLVSIPIEGFSIPWGINILTRKGESRPTTIAVIALLHSAADLAH